jgi:hypothetical protein
MPANNSTPFPFDSSDSSAYTLPEYLRQLLRGKDGFMPSERQVQKSLEQAAAMLGLHLDKRFPPHLAAKWATVRAGRFHSPLCFLVIAAERCRNEGKTLNVRKQAALEKQLRPALAFYELFCAMCDARPYTRAEVEASVPKFNRIIEFCEAFQRCAYPREISALAAGVDFDRRVRDWYVRAHLWSDQDLDRHVLELFAKAIGPEYPDGPQELLRWIPRWRLAVLTDEELLLCGANFRYAPVVEYLIDRRDPSEREPELENRLCDLTRKISKSLTRRHEGFSFDRDDADVAIWMAIDAIDNPLDGFFYCEGLVEFIKSRASVILARDRRKDQRRYATLPDDPPARAAKIWTQQQCDAEDLAAETLHRHAVCVGMPDQAERAWALWIWEALTNLSLKDEVLASMITLSSGQEVTAEALGVARCRLKRYLSSIDVVFKSADANPPVKFTTFEDVLAQVHRDPRGRPPQNGSLGRMLDTHLRGAIASAIASAVEGEPLMIWSSTATVLVNTIDGDPLAEARTTFERMTRVWCDSGGSQSGLLERDLVAERFARLGRWLNEIPGRLEQLRRRAIALNVREVLGAAVYLIVIQRLSVNEALNVLPVSDPAQSGGNIGLSCRYRALLTDIASGRPSPP